MCFAQTLKGFQTQHHFQHQRVQTRGGLAPWESVTLAISSDDIGEPEESLQEAPPFFSLSVWDILSSSCEGPLATVPENGPFKVRQMQAKEQKEQLLQMWGCSEALCLEKGRHPVRKKATLRVPGLAHSLIQQQYDGANRRCADEDAGWDPQKPHGWMSSLASPPCPVPQLPVGLSGWKVPARGWQGEEKVSGN